MNRPCWTLLLIAASLTGAETPRELPPVVYLPGGSGTEASYTPAGKGVWLPYERFVTWWDKANPTPDKPLLPPVGAALTEVALTGTIDGGRAQFTGTFTVVAVASGWSVVELPGALPLLRLACADPRVVIQRKDSVLIHLPGPGTYPLTAELATTVNGEAGTPQALAMALPTASALRVEVRMPGPAASFQLASPGGLSFFREGEVNRVVLAPVGPLLDLRWRPVVAATGDAVLTAVTGLTAHLAPRSLRYDVTSTVTIARRPVDRLRFTVPPEFQVLAVETPDLARWEPAEGAVVLVSNGTWQGDVAVKLRLERLGEPAAGSAVSLPWPHLDGASRSSGSVALISHDGVHLGIAAAPGLVRVDPADLGIAGVTAAFRYHADPPPTTVDWTILAPELRVQGATLVRLGAEETTITARFHVDIRQAGTFTLTVEAPAGWDLLDTGGVAVDEIRPQAVDPAGNLRRFVLQLRRKIDGENDLTCRFRAPTPAAGAGFLLAPPRLVGARSARGVVTIAAPRAWALTASGRIGLAGLDTAEAGRQPQMAEMLRDLGKDDEAALAFTWQGTATDAPKATILASPRPRELSATIEDRITVKDGQIARLATVRGEVRYNPAPTLTLVLPSAWDDLVVVRGNGLAERVKLTSEAGTTTWELRFQPAILGAFQLQIEANAPGPRLTPGRPVAVAVPPIGLGGAGKLSYLAAVARDGAIDLAASAPGLDPVAPADLPAGLSPGAIAGFQGGQAAALNLTATRQDLLALAEAGVTKASWLAVVGNDAVVRLRGRLGVVSRGLTQLALALPAESTLVEATVDGRAVRASRRDDGAVVLPLPADGGSHRVAVVVEGKLAAPLPSWSGSVALTLPRIAATAGTPAVPVARTELLLALGKSWVIGGSSGDLAPEWFFNEGEDDGLSVPVVAPTTTWQAARVGDGGTVTVQVLHERARQVIAVLLSLSVLGGFWLLRRRPVALVAGLGVLGAATFLSVEGWVLVAWSALGAGLVGIGVALLVGLVGWWRARRLARTAVEPDPWIEGGGPRS